MLAALEWSARAAHGPVSLMALPRGMGWMGKCQEILLPIRDSLSCAARAPQSRSRGRRTNNKNPKQSQTQFRQFKAIK